MKKSLLFLLLLVFAGIASELTAQTDPGSANLRHRWTFDGGSAVDEVAGVVGEIVGNGTLANNGFVATNAHMRFPASQIAINSFPELSVEVWCTSVAGANSGWTMLTYFGETIGTGGANCTFLSIARGDNVSMATLEAPNWNGCTGPEYDDGRLHHFIYTVNATTITLYIDGVQISSATLSGSNALANVSTSLAYLGRGGWTADPNWVGTFHKFSLFDKALSPDEVMFLFQEGAEEGAVINVTKNEITLDGNFFADEFNVTGANLSAPISITTPAGITAMPASLPANPQGESVYVVWDGMTDVDGVITLASGNVTVEMRIKTADDSECFVPLYDDIVNLVDNPGMNSLAFFSGWGTREISSIISDPENVYCGASSMAVGNGVAIGSGSLNVDVTGRLAPNTMYRVKAMVKTVDGSFQLGVLGWSEGEGDINHVIDTQGEWQALDFTFTTGNVLRPDVHVLFWNNWQCTGTRSYIDNWEIYEAPDAQLTVSRTSEAFDPEYKEFTFTVTGLNLTEDINIQVPAGLSAAPLTLSSMAQSETVTVVWDGVTPVDGEISVLSSGLTRAIVVKSTAVSNHSCFVPLYADKENMVTDPFLNDMSQFGGWGSRSLVSIATAADSVYCGSHVGRVAGSGSLDVMLTGKMKLNTVYLARAMVMTVGGAFQLGVWGMDALSGTDIQDSIDTQETWMPIMLEFATSDTLGAVQGMFFNNFRRTGRVGYIDNWELYEMGPLSVNAPTQSNHRVFVNDGKIVAEFDVNNASSVNISVFNLQGVLVAQKSMIAQNGRNREQIDTMLPSGVYLVRVSSEGKHIVRKVIL